MDPCHSALSKYAKKPAWNKVKSRPLPCFVFKPARNQAFGREVLPPDSGPQDGYICTYFRTGTRPADHLARSAAFSAMLLPAMAAIRSRYTCGYVQWKHGHLVELFCFSHFLGFSFLVKHRASYVDPCIYVGVRKRKFMKKLYLKVSSFIV